MQIWVSQLVSYVGHFRLSGLGYWNFVFIRRDKGFKKEIVDTFGDGETGTIILPSCEFQR